MTDDPRDDHPDPSRREFLGAAAAVAGAGALFSGRTSLAGSQAPIRKARPRVPVRDGEPLRIGVIGPGGMGTGHVDRISKLAQEGRENVQIVALCDVCAPRFEGAQKLLKERQGAEVDTYGEHEDLLARDDVHGVLIATTEHWHGPIAEDAILAGKDVYVEKPMTLRLSEALRLREVCRANPEAIVQVGTQYIAEEKYRRAKELIAAGAIGKPVWSQTSYCRAKRPDIGEWEYYAIDERWQAGVNLDWERWCGWTGPADWDPVVYARWRRYKRYSTGIIGDLLVHEMTPLVMALDQGWPVRVTAAGGHYVDQAMENHDQVNLTVEFEGGHTLIVAGSTCNEQGLEKVVRGNKATMYLGSKDVVIRPERYWVDEVEEQRVECPTIGDSQDELRLNWLSCIRTREPNWSPVELGTKIMVIVDLATRSMWEGHAFGFDPKTMKSFAI